MANELTYTGIVTDGVLKITNRKIFDQDLKSFEGQRLVIKIKKYKPKRSLSQNNLIHMYFDIIAKETGNSLERVKNILKSTFLTTELKDDDGNIICNPKTGEPLTYVRDTSDLEKDEMWNFTEEVRIFAMDFNIYLPLPQEQTKINY